MRLGLFAAGLAMVGCGRGEAPSIAAVSPPVDPVVVQRDDDQQAAYSLDAACASIAEALKASKALAPIAGGDAKEALLNVADSFNAAGTTLAEHDDAPPPLPDYRKTLADRTGERSQTVNDALDALKDLWDASGTLDDLSQNVPPERKPALDAIQRSTDEAISSVESAITHLGGKVPPEDADGEPAAPNP